MYWSGKVIIRIKRVRRIIAQLQLDIENRPATKYKSEDDGDNENTDISAEVIATEAAKGDKKEGVSDVNPGASDIEKLKEIVEAFADEENFHSTQEEKENYAKAIVSNQSKFVFVEAPLSGSKMFEINPKGNMLHIILNIDHPLHKLIKEFAIDEFDNEGNKKDFKKEDLENKLERSKLGIRFLFMSWARMEDVLKHSNGNDYDNAVMIRELWASYSKNFLQQEFIEEN